jgi:cyclophilin family peptidyl-prolyl cis-trans isomerase
MKPIAVLAALVVVLQVRQALSPTTPQQQVESAGEPFIVLNAEKAWLGAEAFWPLARGGDPLTRRYAIRAIGRLEDPANVAALLALGRQPGNVPYVAPIADAIAQSLYKFNPDRDPDLIAAVHAWFLEIALIEQPGAPPPVPMPLGEITYRTEEQFHAAERKLMKILEKFESIPPPRPESIWYREAATALESLVRLNPKFSQLDERTLERLPTMVAGVHVNDRGPVPAAAFRILVRRLDQETLLTALRSQNADLVRLGAQVVVNGGGGLEDEQRLDIIQDLLKHGGGIRYEVVRAFIRYSAKTRGCQPIVDLMNDPDPQVMLLAIDALGEACKDDEEITKRLLGEVRVPSAVGRWQRETHAFVALARRSPELAAVFMGSFTSHPVFWVRMYSIQAVVAAKDLTQLEKLAYDADDNVREAALEPLLVLKKAPNDPVLISDLGRNDVQLLRSTAILARQVPADKDLGVAIVGALTRLTAEGKETSRDGRLALIDALDVHGRSQDVETLKPLLRDFDPLVASATARLLVKLGKTDAKADPIAVRRGWAQQFTDLSNQCVSVALSTGRSFRMRMAPAGAPIAVDRFLKLALVDHYYDRLSFHRVVPNFVIQGGSPNANEYAGHKEYMRDEIALPNTAGSVGLSIRGRNTGDAQFYINLVDNPRLDRGYTIFARVLDMDVVNQIMEGDVIQSIASTKCPGPPAVR